MIVSIGNMGDIFFVTNYRIHLCKNLSKLILAGRIQFKFLGTFLALLIHINRQNILPVSHEQRIRRCSHSIRSAVTGICQFVLFFIFFLNFVHYR